MRAKWTPEFIAAVQTLGRTHTCREVAEVLALNLHALRTAQHRFDLVFLRASPGPKRVPRPWSTDPNSPLSDELRAEIAAARRERPFAPIYDPGVR